MATSSRDSSVNDVISQKDASVSFVSFDPDVALEEGHGAVLVKSNIISTFRVHAIIF